MNHADLISLVSDIRPFVTGGFWFACGALGVYLDRRVTYHGRHLL